MKRAQLWLALALLIVVNAVVLAGIASNRSGRPDAKMTLTERELVLRNGGSHEENSGLSLGLDWRSEFVREWFGTAKLEETGFAPPADGMPVTRSAPFGRRALPKRVFVVLEYQGKAWQRFQQQEQEKLVKLQGALPKNKAEAESNRREQAQIENELTAGSRLFAVDVGLDATRLRSLYPDGTRYAIVPAVVRMTYEVVNKKVSARGMISNILVDDLHLPRDLAAPLLALPVKGRLRFGFDFLASGEKPIPRYRATVYWGQRHEPWVVAVEVLPKP